MTGIRKLYSQVTIADVFVIYIPCSSDGEGGMPIGVYSSESLAIEAAKRAPQRDCTLAICRLRLDADAISHLSSDDVAYVGTA